MTLFWCRQKNITTFLSLVLLRQTMSCIYLAMLEIAVVYAVKAQTSLAPLSWFPGSRIPTAHVHQCCRFQSYANSHAYEIYKRNLQSVNHIPGIHDNGPRDHGVWRLTLTAPWLPFTISVMLGWAGFIKNKKNRISTINDLTQNIADWNDGYSKLCIWNYLCTVQLASVDVNVLMVLSFCAGDLLMTLFWCHRNH